MNSIALCIPIYRTYWLAEEFLEKYSANYVNAGIDIFYFDSTQDDSVEKAAKKWVDGKHIFYARVNSELTLPEKVYRIFENEQISRKYEYVWLCNDGVRCSHEALKIITDYCGTGKFDVLVVDPQWDGRVDLEESSCQGPEEFSDANEFFQRCTVASTLFGAVIMKSASMLTNVDWSAYENRFLVPQKHAFEWNHVSFYFNRILELDSFSAIYIPFTSGLMRFSERKRSSQWLGKMMPMVCDGWVNAIKELPEYYHNKKGVCVKYGLSSFSGISNFMQYKRMKIYNAYTCVKYWKQWEWLTLVPRWKLLLLSLIPRIFIEGVYSLKFYLHEKKFLKFYRSHPHIAICGAGTTGYIWSAYLNKMGRKYDEFCVTRLKPEKKEYCGHPVVEIENRRGMLDFGCILAVGSNSLRDMKQSLEKAGILDKDIFYDMWLYREMNFRFAFGKWKNSEKDRN